MCLKTKIGIVFVRHVETNKSICEIPPRIFASTNDVPMVIYTHDRRDYRNYFHINKNYEQLRNDNKRYSTEPNVTNIKHTCYVVHSSPMRRDIITNDDSRTDK